MLEIRDLHAQIEGKPILKGLNLMLERGQIHFVMGPNGAGKSTLANVLAGHPAYEITQGQIYFMGQDLLALSIEERAHLGLFVCFQYPPEIPGVLSKQFLMAAYNAKRVAHNQSVLSEKAFSELLDETLFKLQMKPEFKERDHNVGFSGGEKKRSEMLQMAILDPQLAILDETDSGLDIDALRLVAQGVRQLHTPQKGLLVITHYIHLLELLPPDRLHILVDGKIVQSGGPELARELEVRGYSDLCH